MSNKLTKVTAMERLSDKEKVAAGNDLIDLVACYPKAQTGIIALALGFQTTTNLYGVMKPKLDRFGSVTRAIWMRARLLALAGPEVSIRVLDIIHDLSDVEEAAISSLVGKWVPAHIPFERDLRALRAELTNLSAAFELAEAEVNTLLGIIPKGPKGPMGPKDPKGPKEAP